MNDVCRDFLHCFNARVARFQTPQSSFIDHDHTKVDPAAGKIVQDEFPKLMISGYSTHAADLLVDEFAKILVIQPWKMASLLPSL